MPKQKRLNCKFPTEMQRCRIIRSVTTGTRYTSVQLAVNQSGVYYIAGYRYCLFCLSRLWCAATMFTKYCGSHALEKLSSFCTKLILNRDQLVKYLGFHMPELEIIYPFCVKGCRKIRDAEFLEDIRYTKTELYRNNTKSQGLAPAYFALIISIVVHVVKHQSVLINTCRRQ